MRYDVAVIGAGIAGAAAAHEIAAHRRVVLLEREDQPGYHTTGRSAALYTENYGNAQIRALTRGSRPLFEHPPEAFGPHPLLGPRGTLFIGRADQRAAIDALMAETLGGSLAEVSPSEAQRHCPILNLDYVDRALFEAEAMDMDVHAIHQGFLRGFKARGGTLMTDAEVTALERQGRVWRLQSRAGAIEAAQIVNAAGAWADEIAVKAGLAPLGLVPKRRTAFTFDPPPGLDPSPWAMAIDIDEQFYFKSEAGRILGSPADETPSPPCDAQPEEIDIALAADRIEQATTLKITRIARKWAGLRSFFADKTPVVGLAAAVPGFCWLAGQGGYGIMTSPAMGRVAAALVADQGIPDDLRALGVDAAALSPARLGG